MMTRNQTRTILLIPAVVMTLLVLPAAAEIPDQLPDPDGKAPDSSKPAKVYILAGQSNMIGMGNVSGARCRYQGIYLSADPDAPGQFAVWFARRNYKIMAHGVYLSAGPGAATEATDSIYKGKYDPDTDYDNPLSELNRNSMENWSW